MSAGIRAEVRIDSPSDCPIARVSDETGTPSLSISKSVSAASSEEVTEEFMMDTEAPIRNDAVDTVFSYGSKNVYRFRRKRGRGCACERVERLDCPIVDVHTREGDLYLVFHAPDIERLREVIAGLREQYPTVDVQRLIRSKEHRSTHNLAFVDRGSLTERQREVLQTAHEMGYFDHPKGANAGEVAERLDITTSTFTEHLSAAQRKLMGAILDDGA